MKFIAEYLNQKGSASDLPSEYYKTVWADELNEATKQAEKWQRKGYILSTVKQGD